MTKPIYPGDWRYENMELRQQALTILLKKYGGEHPNRTMYECADEWCKKQVTTNGLVSYYNAYYNITK